MLPTVDGDKVLRTVNGTTSERHIMALKLLSLSADIGTLIARNDALASAGFIVSSPNDVTRAPLMVASDHFSAVVIGNSVRPALRQFVIQAIRRADPEVPVIFVTIVSGEDEPSADHRIDIAEDFGPLVRLLKRLTGDPAGSSR